jgi:hypothetical protein
MVRANVTNLGSLEKERVAYRQVAKSGISSDEVEGSYAVRPHMAFAWSYGCPRTFTRWVFDRSDCAP